MCPDVCARLKAEIEMNSRNSAPQVGLTLLAELALHAFSVAVAF